MFDARSDSADPAAFVDRGKDDRHHFRFIVSPEDATEMEDLRAFTHDLMCEAERDLGSKLDWVGVDHWNTDNPHIHILVRGKADDGNDLVISRDYISSGMRARAEHLVSLELGPKSERQIHVDLDREVDAERWTRLDRAIAASADEDGVIDLRPAANQPNPELQSLKIGRLQRLTRLGLATSIGPAQWMLAEPAETILRDLGLRGDIIKTMHRALTEARIERSTAEFAIHREAEDAPIVGRLIARGLSDELTEKAYAIVDGADGRIHHLTFPDVEATSDAAPGAIVELRRYTDARGAERIAFAVRSDLSLADQVKAEGATWLDRRLVERMETPLAHAGFGQDVREALSARIDHLAGAGLASRQAQRVTFARDLLATLRQRELDAVGAKLASETGRPYQPKTAGASVAGAYRQRLSLASGRFAMIDDGLASSWSLGRRRWRRSSASISPASCRLAAASIGVLGGNAVSGSELPRGPRQSLRASPRYSSIPGSRPLPLVTCRPDLSRHVRNEDPLGPDRHRPVDRPDRDLARDAVDRLASRLSAGARTAVVRLAPRSSNLPAAHILHVVVSVRRLCAGHFP